MRLLERRVTQVSLAVRLEDGFAPARRVVGEVSVTLRRGGLPWWEAPLLNPSGDFVFVDLPGGPASVQISATSYLSESRDVTLPLTAPQAPLLSVRLTPAWHYPFPASTTLVQGLVQAAGGAPIADAVVTLVERNVAGRTGADGRFVIALAGLTEDDVTVAGGRRLVKAGASGTTFSIRVEHPVYAPVTTTIGEIEEGRRTVVKPAVTMTPR
jgi:hypothetical protein